MTDYDRRHAKMNQRSTKIVQLLSKEKDEITVSGFAEYFQVSQKTIRNDMKEINEILEKNKRGIIDIKSGGIVSIPAILKIHYRCYWKVIFTITSYPKKNEKKLHQRSLSIRQIILRWHQLPTD